jgi:cytosolic iron-sulfur protein assembly protein CIAO1
MIATASFDGTVVIWEAQNSSNSRWELVASLEGHENEVKCVCWSNDGKWIATCGRDKSVWIWENIGQGEFECVSSMNSYFTNLTIGDCVTRTFPRCQVCDVPSC